MIIGFILSSKRNQLRGCMRLLYLNDLRYPAAIAAASELK